MLKSTLFILLLICTITFGAPTGKDSPSQNEIEDHRYAVEESFNDVTIEKLTPEQLEIIQNGARELNVTTDDILYYIKIKAENLPLARSIKALVSKHEYIFIQMAVEITEFSDPKEISIEVLQENHPKLMDKLVNELHATSDEILFLTNFVIIVKNDKGKGFEGVVRKMQRETILCPVPPDVVRENPSSDEIQKYIPQMLSFDFMPNATFPSQIVKLTKKFCLVPVSLFNKIDSMAKVWKELITLSAQYSTKP